MAINWDDMARFAPIATAAIAFFALGVAWVSILMQRKTARKRAAIDFLLKTEMDDKMRDSYRESRKGFAALRDGMRVEAFRDSPDYLPVRKYLNAHELMAVGIHNGVLDRNVCYSVRADELLADYQDAKGLIEYIRKSARDGTPSTYADLEKLNGRWKERLSRTHSKNN